MHKLIVNICNTQNESTGLTPRMFHIKTKNESVNSTPMAIPRSSSGSSITQKRHRESTVDDEVEESLIPPNIKKKKRFSYFEKSDIPQPKFEFDDSEIIIPAGFNIKNFKSVKKFIDSLNVPQLQKILDEQTIIMQGDIQEDRIKKYFKTVCDKNGIKKKKKKKKAPKVVKEWIEEEKAGSKSC